MTKLATCKLCGFRFNRATDGRSVTAHTLLELREHLRRRGINLSINFKVKAEEFLSHTVTLCEMCYAVTIAEHHLINIERKFAKAQFIPIKVENVSIDVVVKPFSMAQELVQPVLLSNILYQWRVLFYFDYLVGIFNNKLGFENKLVNNTNYYLQFKVFEHITRFPFIFVNSNSNYKLNKLRTHYFFSITKCIDETLKNLSIEIRITEGEAWDKIVFTGKSMSLQEFISSYSPFKTILLSKSVSLFTTDVTQHLSMQVF